MHPADIQCALKKKGVCMADIATALEVSSVSVSNVVAGKTKSRKIASAIAKVIDKPIDDIWPGVYTDVYRRKRRAHALMALLAA